MTGVLTRRALFSRFRGGPPQLRPPWSVSEEIFVEACTLCGKCTEACPTQIIGRGHAGYPIVSFDRGACTFCGACAAACDAGCFDRDGRAPPWGLKAEIAASCVEIKGVACRMCEEACEASAIRFRPMRGGVCAATIDQDRCTGCGACVAPCPVNAITVASLKHAEAAS